MDRALPLTRRTLLAAGGVGALTLAGGGLLTRGEAPRVAAGGLIRTGVGPVRSAYTPHVGSTFTLRAEDGRRVRTRLVEIADLSHARRGDDNAFELILQAAAGEPLPEGVSRLEHPRVNTGMPLLVSPTGLPTPRGQDYSIIVNRSGPPQL